MQNDNLIPINPEKPIRADAARNRELLLETANTLFEANGVADTTMSAIARQAGVGKGTLYRHFNDKADLCHALLDEGMREFQSRTLTYLREHPEPVEGLRWFLGETATYVVHHNELLLEVANQSGIEMLQHPAHLWWRQTIVGLLMRSAPPDETTTYIADMLYVMLDVRTIRFQRQTHDYSLEYIIESLHTTLERLLP